MSNILKIPLNKIRQEGNYKELLDAVERGLIGSIEYGAEHLGAPLVVVLGHTKCGAVTAVVKGEPVTENIGKLVAPIVPAVAGVRERFTSVDTDELISRSIEANVWQAIADMYAASPLLKKLSAEGKIDRGKALPAGARAGRLPGRRPGRPGPRKPAWP